MLPKIILTIITILSICSCVFLLYLIWTFPGKKTIPPIYSGAGIIIDPDLECIISENIIHSYIGPGIIVSDDLETIDCINIIPKTERIE